MEVSPSAAMLVHDRKTFCGVSLPNTAAALRLKRFFAAPELA
jgi:hypothetical protein